MLCFLADSNVHITNTHKDAAVHLHRKKTERCLRLANHSEPADQEHFNRGSPLFKRLLILQNLVFQARKDPCKFTSRNSSRNLYAAKFKAAIYT